jgi:hypothetical protein
MSALALAIVSFRRMRHSLPRQRRRQQQVRPLTADAVNAKDSRWRGHIRTPGSIFNVVPTTTAQDQSRLENRRIHVIDEGEAQALHALRQHVGEKGLSRSAGIPITPRCRDSIVAQINIDAVGRDAWDVTSVTKAVGRSAALAYLRGNRLASPPAPNLVISSKGQRTEAALAGAKLRDGLCQQSTR